ILNLISAGYGHTCAIADDQSLWCWGRNDYGQLGIGNTTDTATPTQVGVATDWVSISAGSQFSCGLRATGRIYCWGVNGHGTLGDGTTVSKTSPVEVSGSATDWQTIEAGNSHVCATKSNG